MIRLDKYLANCSLGSRKEVKQAIRNKRVLVNGDVCRNDDRKIDPEVDEVVYDGFLIAYARHVYIMLNKPAGTICAASDTRYPSVLELIDDLVPNDIFPVGRLDVDTEGLLLITNDGAFSHSLMAPKKHVSKTYHVELEKVIDSDAIAQLEAGIVLDQDETCSPAHVERVDDTTILLTIFEGKYHQVKRMMHAVGNEVTYLKRVKIANLALDPQLELGQWRYLEEADFEALLGEEEDETVS
ncbi:MAG: pseudouridine synthase [Erysipelotrichaceae bacterium]